VYRSYGASNFKASILEWLPYFMYNQPGEALAAGSDQLGSTVQKGGAAMEGPACHFTRSLLSELKSVTGIIWIRPRDTSNQDAAIIGKANLNVFFALYPIAA